MKFLTTYLQPREEVRYRARIHIFLFLQPVILLGIGFMCYFDDFRITHYLGVTLLFLGLVSLVQRVFVKVGSVYAVTNRRVIIMWLIRSSLRERLICRLDSLIFMSQGILDVAKELSC